MLEETVVCSCFLFGVCVACFLSVCAYLAAASNEVGINVGVGSPNPPLTYQLVLVKAISLPLSYAVLAIVKVKSLSGSQFSFLCVLRHLMLAWWNSWSAFR